MITLAPLLTVGAIVLLDLVLSGDNALVIAAAASKLPRAQRTVAIIWGGFIAIALRILLTGVATELLQITWVRAVGAVLLLLVAVRVIWPWESNARFGMARTFVAAVATIIAADVTMSLDNILAIAALAQGQVVLLAIGLICSMAMLFIASALIARVMERLPWLLDIAAAVIAWTAAHLFLGDALVRAWLPFGQQTQLIAEGACVVSVLLVDAVLRVIAWRQRVRARQARSAVPAGDVSRSREEREFEAE